MTRANRGKILASCAIVAIISLQVFATFRLCSQLPRFIPALRPLNITTYCAPRLWPFLTYPMYRKAHYEGDIITRYRSVGILSDSTEISIDPDEIGLTLFKFRGDFVPAMQKEERDRIQQYVPIIERAYGRKLVALQLVEQSYVLQRDGIERATADVVAEIPLTGQD